MSDGGRSMVEMRIHVPEATYEELLRVAKTPEAAERKVVEAIEAQLAGERRTPKRSILSIVGIAEADPDLSERVDDLLYGEQA